MQVDEKIGILLVHGIGEQRRFEHLEAEVRDFAAAIAGRRGGSTKARATVEISRGPCSAFGADHDTWRSDHVPLVRVIVREGNRVTCVCFHEVWWADLGARPGFRSLLAFWIWALGMWAAVGHDGPPPCGLNEQMRLPGALESDARSRPAVCRRQAVHVLARFQLFAVATLFLVATGSVTLVNLALRKLGLVRLPGAARSQTSLGDVMVYRRPTPAEDGPITDLGHPPRAAIRRRMVTALVDMATARYDRRADRIVGVRPKPSRILQIS
jgi:hypothetical protein